MKNEEGTLRDLVDLLMKPDEEVRLTQVAEWRKNDLYWKGCQDLFWDVDKKDWQYADETEGLLTIQTTEGEEIELDPSDFGKIINIVKGHGEAVVAALATSVPTVRWFPVDSDEPMDVLASRTYSKIEQIIRQYNEAELLLVKIAFTMWKQGMVALYNDYFKDPEFGTFEKDVVEMQDREFTQRSCPNCGEYIETTETVPGENTSGDPGVCTECGHEFEQSVDQQEVQSVPTVTETIQEEKGREIIEAYGPLNVCVPHYVTRLREAPYLVLETEHHIAFAKELYPDIADKIQVDTDTEKYSRWARRHQAHETMDDLVTIRRCWLRTWAFNMLTEKKDEYKKKYPKGCYVVFVNEVKAETRDEEMDKHWTISNSPTSEQIHDEPLCRPLIPVQDLMNNNVNLTAQTIEYGIGETFFDPKVLDPEKFRRARQSPGLFYPVKATAPNMPLEKSFHQLKGASLSQEVEAFADRLSHDAQFVVGSFPSIYGGPGEGSETLGEYQESRIQALQRLSVTWKTTVALWIKMMDKAVRDFVESLSEDEKFVEEQGLSHINIWIRKSELMGKVGEARPEATETFPVTWQERQDRLYKLIQLGNEQINMALFHSENVGKLADLLGFRDFHIPGQKDRQKQLTEIGFMLRGEMMEIEADIDMEEVHIEACKAWLISDTGQDYRMSQPEVYGLVRAHMQMHQQSLMEQMKQQALEEPAGPEVEAPAEGPPVVP